MQINKSERVMMSDFNRKEPFLLDIFYLDLFNAITETHDVDKFVMTSFCCSDAMALPGEAGTLEELKTVGQKTLHLVTHDFLKNSLQRFVSIRNITKIGVQVRKKNR